MVIRVKNRLSWLFVPPAKGGGMEIDMKSMYSAGPSANEMIRERLEKRIAEFNLKKEKPQLSSYGDPEEISEGDGA